MSEQTAKQTDIRGSGDKLIMTIGTVVVLSAIGAGIFVLARNASERNTPSKKARKREERSVKGMGYEDHSDADFTIPKETEPVTDVDVKPVDKEM